MAHGVEARFPFLDGNVVACAARMPEDHKLHVLDEKHVEKRVASRLVPPAIVARSKQPYRAPDAASFLDPGAPAYVAELLGEPMLREAGLFDPVGVGRLVAKCRGATGRPLGNADTMAFFGVLSAQLVWFSLCREAPRRIAPPLLHIVDRAG